MLRELDEAARALVAPRVVLFDWHATLVDTLDAMYHAVDDVLPRLPELGLMDALISHDQAKTPEDARLVDYVREHRQLHPKIKAERRISRTDIFEVLLGTTKMPSTLRTTHSTRPTGNTTAMFSPWKAASSIC